MDRIRLLIVDDHEVVRLGLQTALDGIDDVIVAGEAPNAERALEEARASKPDVVLMDVRLDGKDDTSGIDACRTIRSALPETQVLMFSSYSDEDAVLASIMAGAAGYITKNLSRTQLLESIRAAARGDSLLDPKVTGPVLDQLRTLSRTPKDSPLSGREEEVLALVAEGLTNREIAERLVLSEHTVRSHVANLLSKLGLSRRAQAAAYAVREGIITDDGTSSAS
jgi:two-component system response regulator DevR